MSALPRVEQPYSEVYPQLNVDNDVQIVFDSSESHTGPARVPQATQSEGPQIPETSSAQFNVSGYVGGSLRTKRFLPLKHTNNCPSPAVDPTVLDANLGYANNLSKENLTPIRAPRLIRPDASMDVYRPFTFLIPEDTLDLESFLSRNIKVEYDIDETDLGIIGFLATRYRVQILPEIFEVIMSMLDFSAALLCLKMHPLERAAREARGFLNTVDNRRCAVCNWAECTDSNTIVFCDGCDVAVHQDCYGVHSIPEGRWLCRKCESGHSGDIRCVLCPHTSGAFKQTTSGEWVHLVCALWTPIVRVPDDTSFLEPIRDLELMDPKRRSLSCYVCRLKKRGACIQCAAKDCFTAFHPSCAQAAGFHMTNFDHDFSEMLRNQQFLPVYCHRHSLAHAPKDFPPPSLDAARQALADEQKQHKQQNVSLFAKHRFPYWRTKSRALVLPNIVVTAVQRSLRKRLNLELSTTVIEFLCRYWTIKKDYNDGVMFNRRMYHAIEVAEHLLVRAEQSQEQMFTAKELLEVVCKLINVVRGGTQPEQELEQEPEPESEPETKSTLSSDKRQGNRGKKGTAGNTKESTSRSPTKKPASKSSRPTNKARPIPPRSLPSTRKRIREMSSTVASARKLRKRKSI